MQLRKLEAFFKWKEVNLDDGHNNSFGGYQGFKNLEDMEYWSIEL